MQDGRVYIKSLSLRTYSLPFVILSTPIYLGLQILQVSPADDVVTTADGVRGDVVRG